MTIAGRDWNGSRHRGLLRHDTGLAVSASRLGAVNRRILTAVMTKVAQVEERDGEEAACALLDHVIEVMRKP